MPRGHYRRRQARPPAQPNVAVVGVVGVMDGADAIIDERLEELGRSWSWLAERAGVQRQSLSLAFRQRGRIDAATFELVMLALEVDPKDYLREPTATEIVEGRGSK